METFGSLLSQQTRVDANRFRVHRGADAGYDLAYLDMETRVLELLDNPFG